MNLSDDFTCIYCKRQEPNVSPSESDIIPYALGDGLKLDNAVCRDCNTRIGREAEEPFIEKWRFLTSMLGIKGRSGPSKGVRAELEYLGEKVQVYLDEHGLPQNVPPIYTADNSGRQVVHVTGPDDKAESRKQAFGRKHPDVTWEKCEMSEAERPLVSIDVPVDSLVKHSSTRLAAKIAFEVWCYCRKPQEVLGSEYDNIRHFVLEGREPQQPLCQLMYHHQIMSVNFKVDFPYHAVLIAADGTNRLGAIVSIFGLFYYWVLLNNKYPISALWDKAIYIDSQSRRVKEPALRGSLRGAKIPYSSLRHRPEQERNVLQKAWKHAWAKLSAAMA